MPLHFKLTFYFYLIIPTDLRKQARSFENELDTKLVAFSKLGNSFAQDLERFISLNSICL